MPIIRIESTTPHRRPNIPMQEFPRMKKKISMTLLSVLSLWAGAGFVKAAPAPTPAQMLQFMPKQPGINMTTPSTAEQAGCKVELAKGTKLASGKTGSGWVLKDAQGRMLRRYFDSDGDNNIDVWSYYMSGDECYREADSNYNGKVDQYRWLGSNGSKWGVDLNEDGKIDTWKVISAEEASQEALAAVMAKDFARMQALMITKAEMDALELPDSEANRIKTKMQGAATQFQTTSGALAKLSDKTRWVHLETAAPETIPADALGSKADLMHHRTGTVLYSDGDKVNDFLQTGEMILVGRAWRLVDAPVVGGSSTTVNATANGGTGTGTGVNIPETARPLIVELDMKDKENQSKTAPKEVAQYNMERAAILEKIAAAVTDLKDREEWIKQVADSYGTAAQNDDSAALPKLTAMKSQYVKVAPGSALTAYIAFREMSADYSMKLTTTPPAKMNALQDEWKDSLSKFVSDYPTAEDTPDALLQLGMVSEFIGKETEAKNWYSHLVKNFPNNPMAAKAEGANRRLNAEGQPFALTSSTLGDKTPFDVTKLKGSNVVVYYWASWNSQCVGDFAKLKAVMAAYSSKGVQLVCVNLDNADAEAMQFLKANALPATHLHTPGGLESAPATQYGINVLPNLFIVDVAGKVTNRTAQVATLEDELKKIVK